MSRTNTREDASDHGSQITAHAFSFMSTPLLPFGTSEPCGAGAETFPARHQRATVRAAPLLLVDVETEEGFTGRAYQFCYLPAAAPAIAILLEEVVRTVKGDRLAPLDLWAKLSKRFTLIGVQGIVRMAMAMFDAACWDALAVASGVPLATLLGGKPAPVPAYNSNGLGLMAPAAVADEAEKLLAGGFRAVKLRLGYPTAEADLAAVRAVRNRIRTRSRWMVDYNQALTPEEAIRRGRMLDGEGVLLDRGAGIAPRRVCRLRRRGARVRDAPCRSARISPQVHDMERALSAGACDYLSPISSASAASRLAASARPLPRPQASGCPPTCIRK